MTPLDAIANLGLVLENDDLICLAVTLRGGQHPGAFYGGLAQGYVISVSDEQNPVQLDGIALGYIQPLNVYRFAGRYLVLLTAGLNYSVNGGPPL
jgi:hypothetical protein